MLGRPGCKAHQSCPVLLAQSSHDASKCTLCIWPKRSLVLTDPDVSDKAASFSGSKPAQVATRKPHVASHYMPVRTDKLRLQHKHTTNTTAAACQKSVRMQTAHSQKHSLRLLLAPQEPVPCCRSHTIYTTPHPANAIKSACHAVSLTCSCIPQWHS